MPTPVRRARYRQAWRIPSKRACGPQGTRSVLDRACGLRLKRSTSEYCVEAVRVRSLLSSVERVACSEDWSANWAMVLILRLISSATAVCCSVAVAICEVMSVMWATASLMPTRALSASSTQATPSSAWRLPFSMVCTALLDEVCSLVISSWIWLVDCDVRCASCRTSSATTAKPRPMSPARAASIAALSASR